MAVGRKKESEPMDMQQMMEEYKKLGTPGAPHKLLAGTAGNWDTLVRSWTEPGKPPMESKGSCERSMILEGRFLREEFSGDMMGNPFFGIGINGYDNHLGKYVSTWMDSMSTGIMCFEGTADASGKTITQTCDYDDPFKGPMQWRSVTRLLDDRKQVFEMFGTAKGGKEEKMMEIIYTRKA